jgi:hypothetical protein
MATIYCDARKCTFRAVCLTNLPINYTPSITETGVCHRLLVTYIFTSYLENNYILYSTYFGIHTPVRNPDIIIQDFSSVRFRTQVTTYPGLQSRWAPTNSLESRFSKEANSLSETQEIPPILCCLKVNYHVHSSPPLGFILFNVCKWEAQLNLRFCRKACRWPLFSMS